MPEVNTWVYDFADGDRDQKDLLGGKGANLAEMSNLGLPVPPGFTITTEACRAYLEHGAEPDGLADRGDHAPRLARGGDGPPARRPRRPAAGQRPVGRQVLHARDDGDRPQHRPQRRLGGRAWPGRARTSGSRWTPTAGCCRCSAAPCWTSTASTSPTPSTRPRTPRASPTTSTSTSRTCGPWSRRSRASSASTPASSSPRTRASRWTAPCVPSSTRGTPPAPSSTAARSRSPRTSARPSTSRPWSSATAA